MASRAAGEQAAEHASGAARLLHRFTAAWNQDRESPNSRLTDGWLVYEPRDVPPPAVIYRHFARGDVPPIVATPLSLTFLDPEDNRHSPPFAAICRQWCFGAHALTTYLLNRHVAIPDRRGS